MEPLLFELFGITVSGLVGFLLGMLTMAVFVVKLKTSDFMDLLRD